MLHEFIEKKVVGGVLPPTTVIKLIYYNHFETNGKIMHSTPDNYKIIFDE